MTRLLTDDLDHWAEATPDAPAITFAGTTHTWAGWQQRVRRVSGALRAAGVRPGDHVAFLDRNHLACVELTLGAAAIGAANTVVNFRLAPDEVAYVLGDCGARVLLVGDEYLPVLEQIRASLPDVADVVVVGGEHDGYEGWLAAAEPVAPDPSTDPGCGALVMYSSGTTGFPKGVVLSHRGLDAHTEANQTEFVLDADAVNLVAMPLFHVGGSSYILLGFRAGVRTVLLRDADAGSLAGALRDGVTHAFLVPAVIAAVLQAGPEATAAFGRFRRIGYGASPMPLPVLRAAMAAWPDTDLLQVYGMTEVSGVATALRPGDHHDPDHPERLASAGRPITGVELRVVDPVSGDDVEEGAIGEIWLRTAHRMVGYWDNPDATRATITPDGWVRSGDLGRLDDAGYVYVVDRLKDMIITGGENVYSPEVERVLAEAPGVAEVAVVGVPDERWGEAVKAFVAPLPGAVLDPAALVEHCRVHLAHFKCPSSVEVLPVLPRNGTGKILKRELRAPYWVGHDRNVS